MFKKALALVALASVGTSSFATLYTMDFDFDSAGGAIATGATISAQYSGWGFTWDPNAFVGTGWATNSDMTAASGANTGFGWDASMGNVLHGYNGWLAEDDDPSMLLTSANLMSSVTCDFIGDSSGASFIALYDASGAFISDVLVASGSAAVKTVTVTAPLGNAKYAAFAPGYYFDWAGINNVKVEAVPEPATFAVLGLGALALIRRKKA